MIAILVLMLAALSAPVTAATCRPIPRCPNENGCTTTTTNGAKLKFKCSADFNGPLIELCSGTFWDCANACSLTTGCTAFNYKGEFYYHLGSNIGTARIGGTVVAGVMTKVPTTTPSPGSTSCGDDIDCDVAPTDGCIYSSNGKRFIARCNVDFYGGDSGITFTDNLSGCIQQCANTAGCQAVSWSTGTCYLKSTTLQGVWNQWVMGAYLQQ